MRELLKQSRLTHRQLLQPSMVWSPGTILAVVLVLLLVDKNSLGLAYSRVINRWFFSRLFQICAHRVLGDG